MPNDDDLQSAASPASLLFVDDEPNILSALRRLFRPLGYKIFTAEGGAEGLALLEQEPVDLVISDMRMPQMDGAQFLEQVRQKWPDTMRILLTGYADVSSTIAAINKGEIFRYVAKPWEDNDIVLVVKQALELKNLALEKRRLEELTLRQNEELKELNASLESRVLARTEEVRQTMGFLEIANKKLKESFLTSIKVFANLIELRERSLAGHSRRVADLARTLAKRLALPDSEVQDIFIAALLHDIGKIGLPDKLLTKPFAILAGEERDLVLRHPITGQAALMGLEQIHGAAKLIRSHHERWDGMGFPDGLVGLAIPFGARILAVANDFDAVQIGTQLSKQLNQSEAVAYILEGRAKRYDPQVVDAFSLAMGGQGGSTELQEVALKTPQIKARMTLARDLVSPEGIMLLSRDYVLTDEIIEQIRNFERSSGRHMTVHVKVKSKI
ncbi:two-component system response regulator [Sulfurimicrobium lacus]|uniref:Two-component system response regulator n=1 Tax=Sulfurimicrobium lacus TaxID=2715678 RepID=A0A6F8VC44_9PROT|nr:HD domain-containing phosphohydrolase [Sulfurimicrobium lacus]BCB26309.1 two-component system response regulator [Sulfurimicrobium lacus]